MLATPATLNRLETTVDHAGSRYHKIEPDADALRAYLLRRAMLRLEKDTREVVIDLDATHDPLHGQQEGQFFHGRYDCHCYVPLYVFSAFGSAETLIAPALWDARARACLVGGATRRFAQLDFRTLKRWSRERRVIGKAAVLVGKDNPRLVVTSLPDDNGRFAPAALYEHRYCARGTALAHATVGTIRTRLLKIGALIEVSVRRMRVRLISAFPLREVFATACREIRTAPAEYG